MGESVRLKRSILAAVLLGAVALIAVGCGSSNSGGSGGSGKAGSKGPWVIGLSNGYYGNAARVQLEAEVKAFADTPEIKPKVKKVIINNAGESVAKQIAAVNQMIAQKVDAIILDSNSLTGLNSTIARANKAGIPVIAANDKVSSPLAYQVETVGKKFGETMMEGLAKVLNGKGDIVILRGLPGNAVDADEAAGFHGVLQKYPNIHVLKETYGKWDDGQAQKVMADLLSRYPKIDGVFTEGGMQQGVVRAFLAAHRKLVPVSGTDENGFACQVKKYNSQGLEAVQVGTALWADAVALKTALDILSGEKPPKFIPGSWTVWTTEESMKQCRSDLSPSLFLQVAAPNHGVNLTLEQVNKYMGG
jgi:ribose transport system substrate-binding protein